MTRRTWTLGVAILLGANLPTTAAAQTADRVEIPPVVSGRGLVNPEELEPADALARVRLIHAHLDAIRTYMGVAVPPPPVTRASDVASRQVLFLGYNLARRADQLSFEHLRAPPQPFPSQEGEASPAKVVVMLNRSLAVVLRVEQTLGIAPKIEEARAPEDTTPTQVFNALIKTGALMNALLEERTTPTVVQRGLTVALTLATRLHVENTRRFLPELPAFEPNKSPPDAYREVQRAMETTVAISTQAEVPSLTLEVEDDAVSRATSDDVMDLVVILVAEIIHLREFATGKRTQLSPVMQPRSYPSHNVQLGAHLNLVLSSVARAGLKRR